LEELIKNRATIYYLSIFDTNDKEVIEHKPSKSRVYKNLDDGSITIDDIYDEYWFESREDAEFANEFKRVARIDYLDLPTWEEFIKDEKFIEGNEVGFYDDVGIRYKLLKTQYTTPKMICLFEEGIQGDYICEKYELTKENYIKACRKCVELFLGSDVEI